MAQSYTQKFPGLNYVWPNAPKNDTEVQAMVWIAAATMRKNYLEAERAAGRIRGWTYDDDVNPAVERFFDGQMATRVKGASLLENASGALGATKAAYLDKGELAVLTAAAKGLRGALAPGYYKDAANPPFFFFVDDKKVIMLGSSRGPINQTVNAGSDKYNSIVADLKKNGRPVDAATATASARGPSTPQSTEMPAAATATEQSFLDRLVSDPMGALKDAFSNPYVLGGTALVGAGLVYWFFIREPAASPARANRRRRRAKPRETEYEEVEIEEVDEPEYEEEEVEEEEEEEAPRKPKKYGRKNRRGGGKR